LKRRSSRNWHNASPRKCKEAYKQQFGIHWTVESSYTALKRASREFHLTSNSRYITTSPEVNGAPASSNAAVTTPLYVLQTHPEWRKLEVPQIQCNEG
jgi:hypothetical protein